MRNILILTSILFFSTVTSFAGESIDLTVSCVIEGHGGGCQNEEIKLKEVKNAASIKATITEEHCNNDGLSDFCHTKLISDYEGPTVKFLMVNVEAGNATIVVSKGNNKIRVNFYDDEGTYLTTQFLKVNVSVEMTY